MSDFQKFIELVHSTRDKDLLKDLLIGITTPRERRVIGHRLQIVNRLIAGEPQYAIVNDLGIGIATVTRGSRELSKGRFKVLLGSK